MTNRNCLSYWFPKLEAAGVPVPKTRIVQTTLDLSPLCDGGEGISEHDGIAFQQRYAVFLEELTEVAKDMACHCGWPVFLRTGQGSGKHNWKNTCCVPSAEAIPEHVAALVEWSACVDFLGLPTNVWVVREMLKTEPVAVLDAYGDMPLVPEMRAFVEGGKIKCLHPYWPAKAICEGFRVEPSNIGNIIASAGLSFTYFTFIDVVHEVANAFNGDGSWSVDVLFTRNASNLIKLYVTDMAEASASFHWPGCQHAPKIAREP